MRYEKPEVTRVESAIAVIQHSMTKIHPPTPDSSKELTVPAYEADE
jgi:hypothetical protein